MLVPVAAAAVVLTAALSGYVLVKFYGVMFLGQPREEKLAEAHDAGLWERIGLVWLAAGCVLLGVRRSTSFARSTPVTAAARRLAFGGAAPAAGSSRADQPGPRELQRRSVFLAAVASPTCCSRGSSVRAFFHGRTRRAPPWDCGFPGSTPRMQDTAEGFGQPVKQVFDPFFRIEGEVLRPFDRAPRYRETASKTGCGTGSTADRPRASSASPRS